MAPSAREQATRLPLAPGVYRFRDASGRVLYLGRATSLRRRVASYWGDLGGRAHLGPMVARIARVEAVACDSAHEAAWLERNLLQAVKPPWNRAPDGGQEAEVWIRLSDDPRTPGVTVVHERNDKDRHFGPYLGGRQVRLAVSGLGRVLPLTYTGGTLTGARQDMARIRGISEADRVPLAEGSGGPRSRPRGGTPLEGKPDRAPRRRLGRSRLRTGGQAASGNRGPRLGNRHPESHQLRPGRPRRMRVVGRHARHVGDPCGPPHWLDPAHVRRSRSQPSPSRYPAGVGGLRPAKRRTGRPPFRLETQAQDVWPW